MAVDEVPIGAHIMEEDHNHGGPYLSHASFGPHTRCPV